MTLTTATASRRVKPTWKEPITIGDANALSRLAVPLLPVPQFLNFNLEKLYKTCAMIIIVVLNGVALIVIKGVGTIPGKLVADAGQLRPLESAKGY